MCTSLALLNVHRADWRLRLHTVQFSQRATQCTTHLIKWGASLSSADCAKKHLYQMAAWLVQFVCRSHAAHLNSDFITGPPRSLNTDWSLSCVSVQPASTQTKSHTFLFTHDSHISSAESDIFSVLTTITTPTPGIGCFLNMLDFMGLSCSRSNLFLLHFLLVLFRATGSVFPTFGTTTGELFGFLLNKTKKS